MNPPAQLPHDIGVDAGHTFIKRPGSPSPWSLILSAAVTFTNAVNSITLPTFLFVVFLCLLCRFITQLISMYRDEPRLFPFMELPAELRNMVYEELVEDPHYPPPPPCTKHQHGALDWILPARFSAAPVAPAPKSNQGKQSNWIFLANKQIYQEYMDVLVKRATYHLTVSPTNYKAPTISPSATTANIKAPAKKIWNISEDILKQIRKCDLKLVTTSGMLGVSDPRNMSSADWELGRQMREELKHVLNVRELNLHVKAIGDPLWNPLWIWYHASQSFKNMGTTQSDTAPAGPKLNRITFSLDTWSPGENYLERDPENKNCWTWFCLKGHKVEVDDKPECTVREFCARLYNECRTCRPDSDSEDEGGEESDDE